MYSPPHAQRTPKISSIKNCALLLLYSLCRHFPKDIFQKYLWKMAVCVIYRQCVLCGLWRSEEKGREVNLTFVLCHWFVQDQKSFNHSSLYTNTGVEMVMSYTGSKVLKHLLKVEKLWKSRSHICIQHSLILQLFVNKIN